MVNYCTFSLFFKGAPPQWIDNKHLPKSNQSIVLMQDNHLAQSLQNVQKTENFEKNLTFKIVLLHLIFEEDFFVKSKIKNNTFWKLFLFQAHSAPDLDFLCHPSFPWKFLSIMLFQAHVYTLLFASHLDSVAQPFRVQGAPTGSVLAWYGGGWWFKSRFILLLIINIKVLKFWKLLLSRGPV